MCRRRPGQERDWRDNYIRLGEITQDSTSESALFYRSTLQVLLILSTTLSSGNMLEKTAYIK